jgi:hypothetical protein
MPTIKTEEDDHGQEGDLSQGTALEGDDPVERLPAGAKVEDIDTMEKCMYPDITVEEENHAEVQDMSFVEDDLVDKTLLSDVIGGADNHHQNRDVTPAVKLEDVHHEKSKLATVRSEAEGQEEVHGEDHVDNQNLSTKSLR